MPGDFGFEEVTIYALTVLAGTSCLRLVLRVGLFTAAFRQLLHLTWSPRHPLPSMKMARQFLSSASLSLSFTNLIESILLSHRHHHLTCCFSRVPSWSRWHCCQPLGWPWPATTTWLSVTSANSTVCYPAYFQTLELT